MKCSYWAASWLSTSSVPGRGLPAPSQPGRSATAAAKAIARPTFRRGLCRVERGGEPGDIGERGAGIVDADEVDGHVEQRGEHEQRIEVGVPQPHAAGQRPAQRQSAGEPLGMALDQQGGDQAARANRPTRPYGLGTPTSPANTSSTASWSASASSTAMPVEAYDEPASAKPSASSCWRVTGIRGHLRRVGGAGWHETVPVEQQRAVPRGRHVDLPGGPVRQAALEGPGSCRNRGGDDGGRRFARRARAPSRSQ